LPPFVTAEVEAFMRCGILAFGFLEGCLPGVQREPARGFFV
jgi:hypothetical protein